VANIRLKESSDSQYYKDAFGIDFYKLRDEAEKNTAAINGN
jgi:hypothetical protein